MSKHIALIRKSVPLSSISDEEINSYLRDRSFKIGTYERNNIVHFSGEVCLKLEIILSGKVAVERIDESGNLMNIAEFYSNEILGGKFVVF